MEIYLGGDIGVSVGLSLDDFTGLSVPSIGSFDTSTDIFNVSRERKWFTHTYIRAFNANRNYTKKELEKINGPQPAVLVEP